MTAPGPLARKLAEVEAEAARLKDVAHGFVDEIAELTAERDRLAARVRDLENPDGWDGAFDELRRDRDAAEERAERYAKGLTNVSHQITPQYHPGCDPERWVACEAAAWLAERDQP